MTVVCILVVSLNRMETSCMFNVIMAEKKCKNYCIKVIYGVLHMKEILKWLSLA